MIEFMLPTRCAGTVMRSFIPVNSLLINSSDKFNIIKS